MGAKDRLEQVASRLEDLKSSFDGLQDEVRQALENIDVESGSKSAQGTAEAAPGRIELDHVNESLRKLVYGSTQEEILESYLEEAQSYVQRAILFLQRDGRYVTWKGFGFVPEDIRDISLDDSDEVIVRSAQQRQLIYLRDQPLESMPWLDSAGDPPAGCVCIPLVFDNTVPVVFYGDSNDSIAIDSLELLTHLAVLVLKNNYLHQALIAEREGRGIPEEASEAPVPTDDQAVEGAVEEVIEEEAVVEEATEESTPPSEPEAQSEADLTFSEDIASDELSEFDAIEEALADAHSEGDDAASEWEAPTEDDYRHGDIEFQASGQQEAADAAVDEAQSQDFQLEDIPDVAEFEASSKDKESADWSIDSDDSDDSHDSHDPEGADGSDESVAAIGGSESEDSQSFEETAQDQPQQDEGEVQVEVAVTLSEKESKVDEEAKRFARLLVSEIVLYNKEEVEAGRHNSDLYDRLTRDIERSREMYSKRFDGEASERADYFHDEMIRILACEDASLMGDNYPGPQCGVASA